MESNINSNINSDINSDRIEGRNPVLEAIKAQREIDKLIVLKGSTDGTLSKIIAKAKEIGIPIVYLEKQKIDKMSETKSHQGVIAFTAAHEYVDFEDLLIQNTKPAFLVVLDEITDPHNLGSILRSANGAGADGIIIPKRRSVGLSSVVAKTSAGAIEHTPVSKVSNIPQAIDKLKERGIWIVGADVNSDKKFYDIDYNMPLALVIGSEGKGIGRLVKEKCDFLVNIPMIGKIQSLNASVAAGIMMYEVLKQRQA